MEANKTILQMKYARIVDLFAKESGLTLEDALSFFYDSDTYKLISEGVADIPGLGFPPFIFLGFCRFSPFSRILLKA